jgi:hypothetical protein
MGMANLGQMLGMEMTGGWLYTKFGGKTTQIIDGKEKIVMLAAHQGMLVALGASLLFIMFVFVLVRFMARRGHIVTHPEDTRHVF